MPRLLTTLLANWPWRTTVIMTILGFVLLDIEDAIGVFGFWAGVFNFVLMVAMVFTINLVISARVSQ